MLEDFGGLEIVRWEAFDELVEVLFALFEVGQRPQGEYVERLRCGQDKALKQKNSYY